VIARGGLVPRLVAACALLAAACAAPLAPRPVSPRAAAPLRLPAEARPLAYAAELALDPERLRFDGRIEIEAALDRATSLITLHAVGLAVTAAAIEGADGVARTARPTLVAPDRLALAVDPPLPAGRARVRLAYVGRISDAEPVGLFRRRRDGAAYLFTQLEPLDARRVFPCFDEPTWKTPWRLTVRVPGGQTAFANTEAAAVDRAPDGGAVYRFAETPPLPSYLLALAVGPLEVVPVRRAAGAPLRVIVPRGGTGRAAAAGAVFGALLPPLEAYFGRPYPFGKLDVVAVPRFPGAMENPGLVVVDEGILLPSEEEDDEGQAAARLRAEIAAHELAHQWFGNLVTPAWWDDLWLNEAFASWLGTKVVDAWRPGWQVRPLAFEARAAIVRKDAEPGARLVRPPITSARDVSEAFDPVTYGKGQAILEMVEGFVGEEVFRAGVRAYVDRHAGGSARAADFFAAASAAAGRPLGPLLSSFLDQPGVPLVTASLRCAPGAPPTVELGQRPYAPLGAASPPTRTWHVPVCLRYDGARGGARTCLLLDRPRAAFPLPAGTPCPRWLLANDRHSGYYRSGYTADGLAALLGAGAAPPLSLLERLGLVDDGEALVRSGDLGAEALFRWLRALGAAPRTEDLLVAAAARAAQALGDDLVPPGGGSDLDRFLVEAFGARARQLGWEPRAGEGEAAGQLRLRLLPVVGAAGEPSVVEEAAARAQPWLDRREGLPDELAGAAIAAVARRGEPALLARLRAELPKARGPARQALLVGLGGFTAPPLAREVAALAVGAELEPTDRVPLLVALGARAENRPIVRELLRTQGERLLAGLPGRELARLPLVVRRSCDPEDVDALEALFAARPPPAAVARGLADARRAVARCAALRAAQGPQLGALLRAAR
jgi:alanyl aminopeptidase